MTILDITGKLLSAINARRVVLNLLFSFSLSVFYTFLTDDAHPIHKLQKKKKNKTEKLIGNTKTGERKLKAKQKVERRI